MLRLAAFKFVSGLAAARQTYVPALEQTYNHDKMTMKC